jgi:uncharacterized protein (DUF1499 family)
MKILASQGGDMTSDKTALIATVFLAVFFLSACTSAPGPPATMTALPECGWLPNCVNTQSGKGVQSAAPLAADESSWQALKNWLGQQADWQIVSEQDNFMQLTVTTPTVGFTDDVQLLFIPSQQLIQVRSSSRLGLSDMGTNGRRVEALRQQLADFD